MLFRKKSSRREAIRSDVADAQAVIRQPRHRWGQVVVIALTFFAIATAIVYYPGEVLPYHIGDIPSHDILSPVRFTMVDEPALERARDRARASSPPVLVNDRAAFANIQSQLMNLPQDVYTASTPEQLNAITHRWPGLNQASWSYLKLVGQEQIKSPGPDIQGYAGNVNNLVTNILPTRVALVDAPTEASLSGSLISPVLAQSVDLETFEPPAPVMTIALKHPRPQDFKQLRGVVSMTFSEVMLDVITNYLLHLDQPTARFSQELTNKLADLKVARVQTAGQLVEQDQAIVRAGEPIDAQKYEVMVEAQREYEKQLVDSGQRWAPYLSRLGQALTVLIITVAGAFYIVMYLKRDVNTFGRGWALAGLLLLTLLIAKGAASNHLGSFLFLVGVAPTLFAAVIMVIAYNQRFALGVASLHALLVTFALGQNIDFFFTMLTGVTVFVFCLGEIRTRGKLVEVGAFAAVALFICVWVLSLTHLVGSIWSPGTIVHTDLRTTLYNSALAAAGGIAVGFLVSGSLPFVESVFKITTAMRLLELSDTNKPLIRRMATEAMGTYNHSLVLGNMAEAAAETIGANGLLCRVGAYYHDIGKLSKPQYFTENQSGGPNKHDKLSPAMSLLIIVGHVKDGIELAREYRLPWVVHQFIAQHHGTTLVEYFFNAAKEQQAKESLIRGDDAPRVTEAEFRYAGPKPQTRETAILMICDGVEAIVRSMADPSPGRIESVVHQLVMKRLMDGQFSECDLTLRDLSLIEQSVSKTLAGVYHGRVAYPKPLQIAKPA